jgi:hypothetical protein
LRANYDESGRSLMRLIAGIKTGSSKASTLKSKLDHGPPDKVFLRPAADNGGSRRCPLPQTSCYADPPLRPGSSFHFARGAAVSSRPAAAHPHRIKRFCASTR